MATACRSPPAVAPADPVPLTKSTTILSLPDALLARVLLRHLPAGGCLLRHLAVCARVCRDWWRVARRSEAYGLGIEGTERPTALPTGALAGDAERARVMRAVSRALRWAELPGLRNGELNLGNGAIADGGARVIRAALHARLLARLRTTGCTHARPAPMRLTAINVAGCGLTAEGLAALGVAVRPGLRSLDVCGNPLLGDEGLAALAGLLPATLEELSCFGIGGGDEGMAALAEELPSTSIVRLHCGQNPAIGEPGAAALAAALPQLARLRNLNLYGCSGLGDGGVSRLAESLPRSWRLEYVSLGACGVGSEGGQALADALGACPALTQLAVGGNVRPMQPPPLCP